MCGECIVDSWHLWFCVYTYQKAVVIITWGYGGHVGAGHVGQAEGVQAL